MTAAALLPPQLADAHWPERAACRNYDPELWAGIDGSHEAQTAQRICLHECPVRQECLAYAREVGERWLIWGGLTPSERRSRRNPVDVGMLRELAYQGLSDHEISDQLGVPASTVTTTRHRYSIPSGRQVRTLIADDPNSIMLSKLVELLRAGHPRQAIAKQMGVTRPTVDRWCARYRLWRIESRRRP
jgi:transposase